MAFYLLCSRLSLSEVRF